MLNFKLNLNLLCNTNDLEFILVKKIYLKLEFHRNSLLRMKKWGKRGLTRLKVRDLTYR